MHTFSVTQKEITIYAKQRITENLPVAFTERAELKLEGQTVSRSGVPVIRGHRNAFFHAMSDAFNVHVPVVITPDVVWLTILGGLVHHIDQNAESLRHHFVDHQGQKTIVVEVASPPMPFVPDQVWTDGIRKFSDALGEQIGKRRDLILCNFSTTTDQDRISSEIALMGAMKHFFTYKMMLACGLNQVTVRGTPADWEEIKSRLHSLSEFDLKWWTDHLVPVIDQLKDSCAGNPDLNFWRRMFIDHPVGSGSQYKLQGWLCAFFPYIVATSGLVRNPLVNWAGAGKIGIDPDDIPSSLVFAPVTVIDHGEEMDFKFYGGVVGVSVNPATFEHEPVSGWAIQNLGERRR